MVEILLKDYTDELGYEYVIGMGLLSGSYISSKIEAAQGQPVKLRINSVGGDCYAAVQIVNAIKKHGDVTAEIDGIAFSAAAFISAACKSVIATKYTIFMIHNSRVWADAWGQFTSADLKELAESAAGQLDSFDQLQLTIFKEKTGLSEEELTTMLEDETWMTGQQAKDYGFIDELTDATTDPMEAKLYTQAFAHAPYKIVASAKKNFTIKENNMSTAIDEIKANHAETKGLFAELKALFSAKPKAEAEKPAEEAKPTEEKPAAEAVAKTPEQLQAEIDDLKAQLVTANTERDSANQAVAQANQLVAETKTLLGEIKSNYKPAERNEQFQNNQQQQEPEAKFVKPEKKK